MSSKDQTPLTTIYEDEHEKMLDSQMTEMQQLIEHLEKLHQIN